MGTSGSGKTTVARRIAARLGLPHVELDSIYHQPGWTTLPTEDIPRALERHILGVRGQIVECNDAVVVGQRFGIGADHFELQLRMLLERGTDVGEDCR